MTYAVSSASHTALAALRSISNDISESSTRIATGKKINGPGDGAAYWSVATKLDSQIGALNEVKSTIGLGKTTVSTAIAGVEGVVSDLQEVKDLLVSATSSGADRASIQNSIADYIADMQAKANAAVANDENLISVDSSAGGYSATSSIVANFTSNGTAVTITTIDIDKSVTALIDPAGGTAAGILDQDRTSGGTTVAITAIDISALTDSTADQTTLAETIAIVDAALDDAITAGEALGVAETRISSAENYLQALIDAKSEAVTELTAADLDEEATRLSALQTQQQLAIEAMSIANNNMSSILLLFR